MYIYAGYRYLGAIYVECNKAFGRTPLIMIESCNGETIVNIPYVQMIITPRKVMRHNEGTHNERSKRKPEQDGKDKGKHSK